jgi:hypothetical protein
MPSAAIVLRPLSHQNQICSNECASVRGNKMQRMNTMNRRNFLSLTAMASVTAATAALMLAVPSASSAQDKLDASPITPGFWSFPREKPAGPQAIANSCRTQFALQFADGHYFSVRMGAAEKRGSSPTIEEIGNCSFNRDTQVERCTLKDNKADGSITTGAIETRYSTDPDGALRMRVTPILEGPSSSGRNPFDLFPVRCPDDLVWTTLIENNPPQRK